MDDSQQDYYSEEKLRYLEYLEMPVPRKGRLHALILEDPISQLNAPKPIVLEAKDPVSKAVHLMRKFRFGSVLVVRDEKLAGIFTEKDLLAKISGRTVDLDSVPLEEVMTPDPQALHDGEDTIAHALHLMAVGECRHIPIVKGDQRPAGFVSIRGILRYFSENALETS